MYWICFSMRSLQTAWHRYGTQKRHKLNGPTTLRTTQSTSCPSVRARNVSAFSCLFAYHVVFASGVFVIGITALDADEGLNGQVSYSLSANNYFSINATTGVIMTRQTLTSSVMSHFSLIATATDMVRRLTQLSCV